MWTVENIIKKGTRQHSLFYIKSRINNVREFNIDAIQTSHVTYIDEESEISPNVQILKMMEYTRTCVLNLMHVIVMAWLYTETDKISAIGADIFPQLKVLTNKSASTPLRMKASPRISPIAIEGWLSRAHTKNSAISELSYVKSLPFLPLFVSTTLSL